MVGDDKILVREISTSTVGQPRLPGLCSVLVKVHDVPASPAEHLLTSGSIVLGAGRGADLIICDESVSRQHLQITVSNEGIEVVDLNSSNGTYYQGQRIGRLTLDREATCVLGRVKVTIVPQLDLVATAESEASRYGQLVGASSVMDHLFANLAQLETSIVPILIEGEPGTGKSLMAQVIHERSALRGRPCVVLNCASVEPSVARSELFGNASDGRVGVLERAHTGTLILKDVTSLPLDVQPSLLAALEASSVVPVGETHERPAKVRVIATSHGVLANEVSASRFRQDFYYFLNVVVLRSPPLHERSGDVALLAQHFAAEQGVLRLPPQVIEQLDRYRWPGNVRELRNVIRGYAAMGELPQAPIEGDDQLAEMLRRVLDVDRPYQQQKDQILNKFIDVYLSMLLEHTGGNQSQASRMSGIERAHLNRMIAKLRGDSKRPSVGTSGAAGDSTSPGARRRSSLPPRSRG